MTVKKYTDRYKLLEAQFNLWKPHLLDVQERVLPYRGMLGPGDQPNDGKKRTDKRIDATASKALRVMSAGMHGGLTSPSQKWFRLDTRDKGLGRYGPVRDWLDIAETALYGAFNHSNFYQAVQNVYTEDGGFGTACMYQQPHPLGGLWFKVFTCGTYYLSTDWLGNVDTMYRWDWMTAKQLISQFGERCSHPVKQMYKRNPYAFFKICHAIQPRKDRDHTKLDNLNMKWESVYFEIKTDTLLSESGHSSFPIAAPRWDVNGSNVYGISPAMEGLPDVFSINAVREDLLKALNKEMAPPVNVPHDMAGDSLDLGPDGVNVGDGKITATYDIKPNLSAGNAMYQGMREEVSDWFYHNLFVLVANEGATATEIAKKAEEQLVQLGPVIQRAFTELHDPVINLAFATLLKQGHIPPPPPELEDQDYEVEYISTLAQAQKLVGVQKIERFYGFVGGLAEAWPNSLDLPDVDESIRKYADGLGVPSSLLKTEGDVNEVREQRAQQEQQQLMAEQMSQGAQDAATLSNAKLEDKNALSEMVN